MQKVIEIYKQCCEAGCSRKGFKYDARSGMKLWQATEDDELSKETVVVQIDDITKTFSAGKEISFSGGESFTLVPD